MASNKRRAEFESLFSSRSAGVTDPQQLEEIRQRTLLEIGPQFEADDQQASSIVARNAEFDAKEELRRRLEDKIASSDSVQRESRVNKYADLAGQPAANSSAGLSDIEQQRQEQRLNPIVKEHLEKKISTPVAAEQASVEKKPVVAGAGASKPKGDDELDQAQEQERTSQLLANLSRSFGQVSSAMGGIKNDTSFGDAMDKNASKPVDAIMRKRKLAQEAQDRKDKLAFLAAQLEANKLKQQEIMDARKSEENRRLEAAMRPSDDQTKAVTNYNNLIDFGKQIQAEKKAFGIDSGPVSNMQNAIAQKIGMDDPQKSVWRNKVQQQLVDYVKNISGTAASDKERVQLMGIMPNAAMNDATFNLQLEEFLKKAHEFRENTIQGVTAQGKWGHRLRRPQEMQAAGSRVPAANVKPQPGQIVVVSGTRYRVGADGDSLEPIQ